MRIFIPSALRSYTDQQDEVEAEGNTLADLLSGLNARFPGLRFRIIDEQDQIRTHIKIFVNQEQARDLDVPLQPGDEISILLALSGGQGFSLRGGLRTIE
jgi:molybdopterin converting factor small subunit